MANLKEKKLRKKKKLREKLIKNNLRHKKSMNINSEKIENLKESNQKARKDKK